MADEAGAGRRDEAPLRDRGGGIGRRIRPLDRRIGRAPGQEGGGQGQRSGAGPEQTGEEAATPARRIVGACDPRRVEGGAYGIRGEREFAEADAGGVEQRVGDRRRARHRGRFAGPERRIVRPLHHQHVDLGDLREGEDRVAAPFPARHPGGVEADRFAEHPARRLDHVAVDLVAHPVRVDHQAGILADHHPGHRHLPVTRLTATSATQAAQAAAFPGNGPWT